MTAQEMERMAGGGLVEFLRRGWGSRGSRLALTTALSLVAPIVSSSSEASLMIALDLPALVRKADHIAVVDVASVRSAWDEKHERIYSTIELDVVETWKTSAASAGAGTSTNPTSVTVVQPGGTVGDMSMVVMGMSTFTPGTRSLVFLRGSIAHAQVVGMTQGLHPLTFEPVAKRWTVSPAAMSQVELIRPVLPPPTSAPIASGSATAGAPAPRAAASTVDLSVPVPLDTMKAEVMRLLSAASP